MKMSEKNPYGKRAAAEECKTGKRNANKSVKKEPRKPANKNANKNKKKSANKDTNKNANKNKKKKTNKDTNKNTKKQGNKNMTKATKKHANKSTNKDANKGKNKDANKGKNKDANKGVSTDVNIDVNIDKRREMIREMIIAQKMRENDPNVWNFRNALNLCRKHDTFQIKEIASSILQGKLAGELSDEIYTCINDRCYYMLAQVIQNGLTFSRIYNHRKFEIQDFKRGLIASHTLDKLPPSIPLTESLKFAFDRL